MGKKRTNAAKKKQVAKKRLSSAYGVSVQKGGTIARNKGAIGANHLPDGKQKNAQKQNGSSSNGQEKINNIAPGQAFGNGLSGDKRPRGSHGENDEFERSHASLEERSLALQARNDEQRRCKKGRRKQHKKGWGKFVGPSATKFSPAMLTLAPKTTQQLVDDAADQVAQGMNDIGQRATTSLYGVSDVPGQSSLSAAASLNWKLRVSNVSSQEQQQPTKNNPYEALDVDSDSDNEWAMKKTKAVQQFQFKPASFSCHPTAFSAPIFTSEIDDIDPDL
mmetsp:Transcript_39725/g.95564  ORF Transcript_39725/g.95564 Transcript_39725/m.95564 type:complete len:277 (-) Transcript_39725:80-910(-)